MRFVADITGSTSKMVAALGLTLALSLGFGAAARADEPKPMLYVLSVGVCKYQHIPHTKHCTKDALDMAAAFKAQEGKVFGKVHVQTLVDADATAARIRQALAWISARADAKSQVIVFFSGHGNKNFWGQYVYMAHDTQPANLLTAVSWSEMKNALDALPCKSLLMINSCFSGAVSGTKNITVLSSSLSTQVSFEGARNNGYFTLAVLEALSGRADKNHDGTITLAELNDYVADRVTSMSNGKQIPTTTWAGGLANAQTPLSQIATAAAANTVVPGRTVAMKL